jgi:hypothetical protein
MFYLGAASLIGTPIVVVGLVVMIRYWMVWWRLYPFHH